LKFRIEPQTEEYIRYAIESGVYERLRLENHQAPALTTRLKAEFKYILQAPYWKSALTLLDRLGALRCLYQGLKLTPQLWWQIRCVSRWLRFLDSENNLEHWLTRLEVLIAHLEPSQRGQVAQNLQLPKDSIERLQRLARIQAEINQNLPNCQCRSEIYKFLRQYQNVSLILVAVRSPKPLRRTIWQYLTQLSQIKPPLDGNDLKALGYKPGPIYKQILDDLLIATLDGQISDRTQAEIFVKGNY
jgi:tRNA nucleotidyltransferase (CCA-adding enzyme)